MEAARIIALLRERKLMLATAESCTGGLLAAALTAVPGCSACFGYGLVTYSNEAKQKLLGVPAELLAAYGAVSAPTAAAMARGLCELSQAHIGISITGVAGPGGASADKPAGLVYIGLCLDGQELTEQHNFRGGRDEVRAQTVTAALSLLERVLENNGGKQ